MIQRILIAAAATDGYAAADMAAAAMAAAAALFIFIEILLLFLNTPALLPPPLSFHIITLRRHYLFYIPPLCHFTPAPAATPRSVIITLAMRDTLILRYYAFAISPMSLLPLPCHITPPPSPCR